MGIAYEVISTYSGKKIIYCENATRFLSIRKH